jgi:hypothetical protein
MRHLHHTVLAVLAVALCAAPAAGAHDPYSDRGGAVVAPAKDKWLGESWAQIYSLPVSENPFAGNGNPCLTLANNVIQAIGRRPCTIEQGTTFMTGFGGAWSSAEDPFPQTRAEQLALMIASDRDNVAGMTITVDGGDPVEIRTPRFELFSPQRTVLLPEDNLLDDPEAGIDVPAQTVTLTAHAWGAAVRKLSVGEHTIVGDTLFANGNRLVVPHVINVVPRHRDDRARGHHDAGVTSGAPIATSTS